MIRYFANHPTAANLMMAAFIILGLFAAPTLQRETFPRIEARQVEASVPYPGARPEDVEEAICVRIEDAVDGVNDIAEVTCEAQEGVGRAVFEMTEGADLDRFFTDIKAEIEAIADFPDEVEQLTVRQLGLTDFVASVAVSGPLDKANLKPYAEELKVRMLRWGGIPKVEIKGFSEHQIRIEISDQTLRQFALSMADIARAVQRQSIELPVGSIQSREDDLLIRFADERKTADEFLDLVVVSSETGGQIRLGDIAQVSDRFELEENKITLNGRPAAVLDITKTQNDDTLEVIDAVNAFLDAERQVAPAGVELVVTNDVSSIVRDRLQLLLKNGATGLGLVFLCLWVFFGLRYSFWVTMGLPVAFLGAVAAMVLIDYSINMLTMVGLLIVIGLLMDDAIVIAENIEAQRRRGKGPLEAAVDGARQVLPSVFASFATTACIFGSLAFLKGDIGQILRVVPIVMLVVLIVSLIEAFLILPNHLKHTLESRTNGEGRVQARVNRAVTWISENVVFPAATLCVRWRYLTVGVAFGLLLLAMSALAGGLLKFAPFPELDGDVMVARILLPQGTPLERTEQVVETLTRSLGQVNAELTPQQPEEKPLVQVVVVTYSQNTDAGETGAHLATITVDLLGSEERTSRIDDVLSMWREATGDLADVISVKFAEAQVGPAGIAIDVRLTGDDLDELKGASLVLQEWLGGYRGVLNIEDNLRPGKSEVRVSLDPGASQLGIDGRMVADQLRSAFFGTVVSEVQEGSESFEIDVRLDPRDRNSIADLDYFAVTHTDGSLVPLSAVAEIVLDRGYSRISRIDGQRTVSVQADVDVRVANSGEVLNDTETNLLPELAERFPGVSVALEGENAEAATTQRSMMSGFVLGLIGVFLLLSFQFRSYVEPFVVMVIIPFAFIGAVGGHLLLGLDFTMPSMLGFVALAGVVVNDSILLVNFIKHYHGDVQSVVEAAPMASRARFRAILLTSLTTIAGLMPLLAETSLQAQVLVPLVTSLAFGLAASTMLVLLIVPAIYSILDDFGLARLDRDGEIAQDRVAFSRT